MSRRAHLDGFYAPVPRPGQVALPGETLRDGRRVPMCPYALAAVAPVLSLRRLPTARLLAEERPARRITVRELSKVYRLDDGREFAAVDHFDLDVEPSEVVTLIDPSGSGKSTLLHLIGGIDVADAGSILVDGRR